MADCTTGSDTKSDTSSSPGSNTERTGLRSALQALLQAFADAPNPDAVQRVLGFMFSLRQADPAAPDAPLATAAQGHALALVDDDTLHRQLDILLQDLPAAGGQAHLAQASVMLLALRNRRDFSRLATLAEAVRRLDPDDATNQRLYGQALIETGHASVAITLLLALQQSLPVGHPEAAEAQGLLGRAHKQIFFDARDQSSPAARRVLAAAISAYQTPYAADPVRNTWQGVNLLALLTRARREGWADLAPEMDPAALARQLQTTLLAVPPAERDDWFLPTLAEVALGLSLASGDLSAVEQQLAAYVGQPGVQAFQVASTLRQFTEVWGLDSLADDAPGTGLRSAADVQRARHLVDILRARLLQLPGGGVALSAAEVRAARPVATRTGGVAPGADTPDKASDNTPDDGPDTAQLEAVLGVDGPQTYAWWRAGVDAARSVAVVRQRLGNRLGTGFLVRASDFGLSPPDEALLLTNFHVINPDAEGHGIKPESAEVVFEADDTSRAYAVSELLWCSSEKQHDACLVRLAEQPKGIPPLPLATSLPTLPAQQNTANPSASPSTNPAANQAAPRVYIIGHPGGRELSFSFQDNEMVDHEGPDAGQPQIPGVWRVHYRAPTEGGNSGSPVFNATDWQVIALHHMGSGKRGMPRLNGKTGTGPYFANEGLAMVTLVAAAKAALNALKVS